MLTSTIQNLTNAIGGLFSDILGSQLYVGILLFLIISLFAFVYGLGVEVASIILTPTMILVMVFIEPLRPILGVFVGILIGIMLIRLYRR